MVADKGALLVDSDEAKAKLPEFSASNGVLAGAVHKESKSINKELLYEAIKGRNNVVIPVVGHELKGLQDSIDNLKNNGYRVSVAYVDLPVHKAVARGKERFIKTGRYVPIDYIEAVGDKPKRNYAELKDLEGVDFYEYDNGGSERADSRGMVMSSETDTQEDVGGNLRHVGQSRPRMGRSINGIESEEKGAANKIDKFEYWSNDVARGEAPVLIERLVLKRDEKRATNIEGGNVDVAGGESRSDTRGRGILQSEEVQGADEKRQGESHRVSDAGTRENGSVQIKRKAQILKSLNAQTENQSVQTAMMNEINAESISNEYMTDEIMSRFVR